MEHGVVAGKLSDSPYAIDMDGRGLLPTGPAGELSPGEFMSARTAAIGPLKWVAPAAARR